MTDLFSHSIKYLINKVLCLQKNVNRIYQLSRLTVLLVLSVYNRGFLGPLSILLFSNAF